VLAAVTLVEDLPQAPIGREIDSRPRPGTGGKDRDGRPLLRNRLSAELVLQGLLDELAQSLSTLARSALCPSEHMIIHG
jgi:hypothetical protein